MKIARNKKLVLFAVLLSLFLFSTPLLSLGQDQSESYPAKVKDISNQKYEPAVTKLLGSARESIVISMYIVQTEEGGPVRLLAKDLEEALERGVSVDIYLSMRFQEGQVLNIDKEESFNILKEKGGRIFDVTSSVRMHDKLIIVDNRYMVTGNADWSAVSLKDYYVSATLIDSPEFASDLLLRLGRHTLKGK